MTIQHIRYHKSKDHRLALWMLGGEGFACHVLERDSRSMLKSGQSYDVVESDTEGMLRLAVNGVTLHDAGIGLEGVISCGFGVDCDGFHPVQLYNLRRATKHIYSRIHRLLEAGEKVTLHITEAA